MYKSRRPAFAEGPWPFSFMGGKLTFSGHSGFAAHRSLWGHGSGRQVRLFVLMDGMDQGKGSRVHTRSGFRLCQLHD